MRAGNGFECECEGTMPLYFYNSFRLEPDLVHAVLTRKGGVSRVPYNTLNLGQSVGDLPADVATNMSRALEKLQIGPEQVVTCHMVHSASVQVVSSSDRGQVIEHVDGLVTGAPGTFLFMRFADCLPILFNDPTRRVVAIAHAGWRGTVKNIAGATVQVLVNELGCSPANIRALLGPAIGPCCYEVGDEVIESVELAFQDREGLLHRRNGHHAYFDLWEANRRQLAAEGVFDVGTMNICTACHNDKFFSHRADRGVTGRFGAVIGYAG